MILQTIFIYKSEKKPVTICKAKKKKKISLIILFKHVFFSHVILQTIVMYKTVKDSHYLSQVSRRCQFEHGNCDNHCNPESGVNCFSCCNANNNCNSLPMSSVVLPPHLTYNVTNMAAPEVIVSGSTASIQLFIFIVNFFVM